MSIHGFLKKTMARPWVRFPVTVMKRFGDDNGGLAAAGLAFFMLLSFAPLILTAVACLAFFIHNPAHATHYVQSIVRGLFPSGGAQQEINRFLTQRLDLSGQVNTLVKGRTLAGVIGFLTLLWTSMQIYINASSAMNAAFEVKEKRSWLLLRGVALGLLLASGFLVSLTLFLSAAPPAIARWHFLAGLSIPLWLLTILFEILAVLANSVLYVLIYRFLPSTNVTWRAAAIGGLTASIFWEVAKKGLASWLLKANHSVYGDLANLILFVLWIYYSMMIMLIGAEVAAVVQKTGSYARRPVKIGHDTPADGSQPRRSPGIRRDESIRKNARVRAGSDPG